MPSKVKEKKKQRRNRSSSSGSRSPSPIKKKKATKKTKKKTTSSASETSDEEDDTKRKVKSPVPKKKKKAKERKSRSLSPDRVKKRRHKSSSPSPSPVKKKARPKSPEKKKENRKDSRRPSVDKKKPKRRDSVSSSPDRRKSPSPEREKKKKKRRESKSPSPQRKRDKKREEKSPSPHRKKDRKKHSPSPEKKKDKRRESRSPTPDRKKEKRKSSRSPENIKSKKEAEKSSKKKVKEEEVVAKDSKSSKGSRKDKIKIELEALERQVQLKEEKEKEAKLKKEIKAADNFGPALPPAVSVKQEPGVTNTDQVSNGEDTKLVGHVEVKVEIKKEEMESPILPSSAPSVEPPTPDVSDMSTSPLTDSKPTLPVADPRATIAEPPPPLPDSNPPLPTEPIPIDSIKKEENVSVFKTPNKVDHAADDKSTVKQEASKDRSKSSDHKSSDHRDKSKKDESRDRSRKDNDDHHRSKSDRDKEREKDRSKRDDRDRSRRDEDRDRSRKDDDRDRDRDRERDKSRSDRDKEKSRKGDRDEKRSDRRDEKESSRKRDDHSSKRSGKDEKEKRKKDEKDSKKDKPLAESSIKDIGDVEEEMRKRRERIEAWRNKRKGPGEAKEEEDTKENGDVGKSKKVWSLEDDDEDDEDDTPVKMDEDDDEDDEAKKDGDDVKMEEEEDDDVDPLDAFMKNLNKDINKNKPKVAGTDKKTITVVKTVVKKKEEESVFNKPEVMEQNQDALEYSSEEEEKDILEEGFQPKKKKKELTVADHSMIYYASFRKSFYVEVPELAKMTPDEVKLYREELDDIQVRGKNPPKPIRSWAQSGVNAKILDVLKKCNYEKPTSIQAQAIPTVMSGRDVIGIAKTGSGKTLAFLLPMFRHIMDQPPLDEDDGPIGIVMTPTRELALQIFREAKKFCKALKLTAACIYGGSGIGEQIAELKRGAEIIVCTPGRMIDMLTANNGRVTNCRRCTYLVLDEADRMFDMGFEPQVMHVINSIRPDRQLVMFSATFPRSMEALARRILQKPVEIMVGGRSIVCSDIEQQALVIDTDNRFFKLLELLGVYQDKGSVLVFVEKQETADVLFKDLLGKGYPCLSLHGGMDQYDRDSTIADFKNGVTKLMVSTSVAARGLDVKNLNLVVNYDCPNHYEDYVHRVGRTGRAGNKGTAFTLITYEQGKLAGDVIKAFELSKQTAPPDVVALWEGYKGEMEKEGKKVKMNSGFSGKGFKFDAEEEAKTNDAKKMQKFSLGLQDSDDEAEAAENAMEKIDADLEKAFSNKPKMQKFSLGLQDSD